MKILPVLILTLLISVSMLAARKMLLIGNAAYTSKTLKNPINDASDLEAAFKNLGFITTLLEDPNYLSCESFNAINKLR